MVGAPTSADPGEMTPLQSPSPSARPGAVLMVVPTYNERENLERLVSRMAANAPGVHLLVVDDASPDGTADHCRVLMEKFPNLKLLSRNGERGLGRAYVAGLLYGLERGYEVLGTMDADLSHDPAHLPGMLALIDSKDVVIGSRYIKDGGTINWRIRRILLSWLANKFASALLGLRAHDVTSGYRLYRASFIQRLDLGMTKSSGYSFLVELLYRLCRLGARVDEFPIIFFDRSLGESKLGSREIYLGMLNLFRLRFAKLPDSKES